MDYKIKIVGSTNNHFVSCGKKQTEWTILDNGKIYDISFDRFYNTGTILDNFGKYKN
jgi:hypothetical protein